MVKSKKMSKTSIAVIVLAILLVLSLCLGLTGAWFTAQSATATDDDVPANLVFGKIGTVALSLTEASWDKHDSDGARTYVLPGDEITGTGFTITYTQADANDDGIYYVLKATPSGESAVYYVISGNALVAASSSNVGELYGTGGTTNVATMTGVKAKVNVAAPEAEASYVDITAANAGSIGNNAQGRPVVFQNGVSINSVVYQVLVCQRGNLDAAGAYTLLTTGSYAYGA